MMLSSVSNLVVKENISSIATVYNGIYIGLSCSDSTRVDGTTRATTPKKVWSPETMSHRLAIPLRRMVTVFIEKVFAVADSVGTATRRREDTSRQNQETTEESQSIQHFAHGHVGKG